MLYICIPTHDEAPTVGVLLWRIRKMFQDYAREYEVLVYDDASSDGTREILEPYEKALPLTVLGGKSRVGYAKAVDALMREAANRTRYPRRDAAILMQADFTDRPEEIPELVKRFEGGADIVVGEPQLPADAPEQIRKLHQYAGWLPKLWPLKRGATVPGVKNPYGSMRLLRISTLRDLLRGLDATPLRRAESTWQTNLDILAAAVPHARRVETVATALRYDVRMRETRRNAKPEAWSLAKAAWAARGRSLGATVAVATTSSSASSAASTPAAATVSVTSGSASVATPSSRPAQRESARERGREPQRDNQRDGQRDSQRERPRSNERDRSRDNARGNSREAVAGSAASIQPTVDPTIAPAQSQAQSAERVSERASELGSEQTPEQARERARRKRSRGRRGRGERARDLSQTANLAEESADAADAAAEDAATSLGAPDAPVDHGAESDLESGESNDAGDNAAASADGNGNPRSGRRRRSRRGGRRRREG